MIWKLVPKSPYVQLHSDDVLFYVDDESGQEHPQIYFSSVLKLVGSKHG